MRIAGFLALHREKIGTKLYGYVLAKRYTKSPKKSCNGSFHRSIAGAETAGQNHEFLGALERGR